MITRNMERRFWYWMIAPICCLALSGGCATTDANALESFATDLLLNAVAALLL